MERLWVSTDEQAHRCADTAWVFRIRTACVECGLKWFFDRLEADQVWAIVEAVSCDRCGGRLTPIEVTPAPER